MTVFTSPSQSNSNSNLVSLYWTLRQRLASRPQAIDADFERLLNNRDYRQSILSQASAINDPGIQQLVRRLQETDVPDSLADNARQHGLLPTDFEPVISRPWRRMMLILLSAAVIAVLVNNLWEGLLQTVTGTINVSADIGTDTTWRSNKTYRLTTDIFVHDNAVLRIEPGTLIQGKAGSSLVIARGSEIRAEGTADAPIVFTSSKPVGQRDSGDWGGVVLLGDDKTNEAFARVEGVDGRDIRGHFGGQVNDGSCGTLRYVRIEYAGFEAFVDNELNGLTVAGCGPNTTLEYIQVHRALDDGIEFFGGSANLRYALITGARDDSLDWDLGWDGKVQFLIAQQYPGSGDRAFEGDNSPERDKARPRSTPLMSNVTLIGTDTDHTAMVLRSGTAGTFSRFLIGGYGDKPIDLRGPLTSNLAESKALAFDQLVFSDSRALSTLWPTETGNDDNDAGFAEETILLTASQHRPGELGRGAFNLEFPDFRPSETGFTQYPGIATDWPDSSEFWDRSASQAGAVAGKSQDPWYLGWTDFSRN